MPQDNKKMAPWSVGLRRPRWSQLIAIVCHLEYEKGKLLYELRYEISSFGMFLYITNIRNEKRHYFN